MRKVFLLLASCGAFASAQNNLVDQGSQSQPAYSVWDHVVFGGYFGVTGVNGPIIRKFGDLSLSPKYMSGSGYTAEVGYQITPKIQAFVGRESVNTHGTGLWQPTANNQQEVSEGITGNAQGAVRSTAEAWQFGGYYTFLRKQHWELGVKGGVAVGHRWTDFSGTFYGFDGYDNFTTPATDHQSDFLLQPVGGVVVTWKPGGPLTYRITPGFGIGGAQVNVGLFKASGTAEK